jgi:hypothetical protein
VLGAGKPAVDPANFFGGASDLAERARTVGLVGASGASRLMQRLPRHSSFRSTASTTALAQSLGDSLELRMALAWASAAGSCTSKLFSPIFFSDQSAITTSGR